MQYIFSTLMSVASAMLIFLLQYFVRENINLKKNKDNEQKKKEDAIEEGVRCLLRVKLIEYHTKYMELGEISSHGYENWMLMYKAYKALGGNGMIEHMKEEIEELHISTKR